jgi:hypothetical protein
MSGIALIACASAFSRASGDEAIVFFLGTNASVVDFPHARQKED